MDLENIEDYWVVEIESLQHDKATGAEYLVATEYGLSQDGVAVAIYSKSEAERIMNEQIQELQKEGQENVDEIRGDLVPLNQFMGRVILEDREYNLDVGGVDVSPPSGEHIFDEGDDNEKSF